MSKSKCTSCNKALEVPKERAKNLVMCGECHAKANKGDLWSKMRAILSPRSQLFVSDGYKEKHFVIKISHS